MICGACCKIVPLMLPCSRIWAIEVPTKIYKFSKNIEKTPYRRVAQKGTILHQAPQITLFFDPVYIYIWRNFNDDCSEFKLYAYLHDYICYCKLNSFFEKSLNNELKSRQNTWFNLGIIVQFSCRLYSLIPCG